MSARARRVVASTYAVTAQSLAGAPWVARIEAPPAVASELASVVGERFRRERPDALVAVTRDLTEDRFNHPMPGVSS